MFVRLLACAVSVCACVLVYLSVCICVCVLCCVPMHLCNMRSSQKCFDVIFYSPVEKPTRPLISINIADLQPYPAVSPNSPGGVAEPYDVKTPALLRLVQREVSENPQGNRYG